MAKYYRHYWDSVNSPPDVPMGGLKGGKIAKSARAHAVFNGLDKIPALGRRVILARSMSGANAWQSGTPAGTISRVIARAKADITPGCILSAGILYLPPGSNTADLGWGQLEIEVEWLDRDSETTTTTNTITMTGASDGTFSNTPWGSLATKRAVTIAPPGLASITAMQNWSRYTAVTVTVSYNGNPRPVDFVVYERPYSIALEADDDSDYWVSGMFASGSPSGAVPNLSSPLQRMSETTPDGNRRGGTWQLMDQAAAQAKLMGPMLFTWTGHNEESDSASEVEDGYTGGAWTSSNYYRIGDGASVATASIGDFLGSDDKGFGLASGSYARPARYNDATAMANTGAIPVRVHARISSNDTSLTSPFEFRVMSTKYSYVEITGTAPGSLAPEWFTAYGYLKCGKGPGDDAKAVAVARPTSGANGLRVYDVQVYKAECPRASVPPPQSGLVFHADMQNTSSYPGTGTTVTDLITSDTGTESNVTVGTYHNYNGSTSELMFSDNANWIDLFSGGGSLVAVVRPESDGEGNFGRIADKSESVITDGWSFFVRDQLSTTVQVSFQVGNGTLERVWEATPRIDTDEWSIVVLTWDSDNYTTAPVIYFNGSSQAVTLVSANNPGPYSSDSGNDLYIGNRSNSNRTWDGDIDVFMMYDRTITSDEVTDIYDFYKGRYGL